MPVSALELKPRKTIALFDAALRLCARSSGVWSLTLPAGACVIAALFRLVEAVGRHGDLRVPAALFTAAWIFRAVSMGAACHYLEAQVLGVAGEEPSAWKSFRAGLLRSPSLIITAAFTAFLNGLLWCLSMGLGLLFFGAHNVAYAVAMRGQGSPLAVYGTSAKLLGPARQTAAWIRLCGLSQLLVLVNLHLVTAMAIYLGRTVVALDLTFLDRFTSIDNPTWLAVLVATTFTLFEPLRAATATLLLIDGRVRLEGLDLLATLEQLPRRRKRTAALATVALLLMLPSLARAEGDDWSGVYSPGHPETPATNAAQLQQRLQAVVDQCKLDDRVSRTALDNAGQLSARDQSALSRFVARVERHAWDEEDCKQASVELQRGLELIAQTRKLEQHSEASAQAQAAQILSRPEFAIDPPAEASVKAEDEPPGWFSAWWKDLMDRFYKWLRNRREDEPAQPERAPPDFSGATGLANAVMILAIVGVVGLLLWLLIRSRDKTPNPSTDANASSPLETVITADPLSALSRAPESWAGMADVLAAEGRFREAIRHLYLATLSRLHRDGAIDYDPAKSNWDYFRAFKGLPALLPPFRELTRRFDLAWYGNLEVSSASWQTFRTTCEPLLAVDGQGMAASA